MKKLLYILIILALTIACEQEKEHTAPAINDRDSVSMMRSYGVNTLISDSGVMKYRIIAEEWEVNVVRNPSRWIFPKGMFMEQFDEQFHIEAYVQCDTAYYYDMNHLWELRGNVRIRTVNGLRFSSNELFWDQTMHEFYSNKFSRVITPERTMEGTYFRSDENMQKYYVSNSKGSFEKADFDKKEESTPQQTPGDTTTIEMPKRQQTPPSKKNIYNNV